MDEVNNQYQPMTVGQWLITYLLMCIPIAGFVLLIVWAASGSTHPSKKSWAIASLIWAGIFTVLYILLFVVLLASM